MDFFERLGDTITFTGRQVVQKAQETADLARLNSRILYEKDKMRTAFAAIGEKYYKEHLSNPEEKYSDYVKAVKESSENIILLKKKIGRVRGVDTCAYCGSEIASNSNYCNICGKSRDNDTEKETDKACDTDEADIFED